MPSGESKEPAFFDLMDPEVHADPYPAYRWLRDNAPVYKLPGAPMWVISRYDDVDRILRDAETFASSTGFDVPIMSLVMKDPPDHDRLRQTVSRAFTPRAIDRLAPRVEALATELLDRISGHCEFMETFANPLPVAVICEMLGVPAGDRARMKRWSRDALLASFAQSGFGTPQQAAIAGRGLTQLLAFLDRVIARHRQQPSDNIISTLVALEGEGVLTADELRNFSALLLIAGHETTANLIGSGAAILADRPLLAQRLRENPELLPRFVEELVRFAPPLQRIVRRATRAVQVGATEVPANGLLMLLPGSANRDERWKASGDFDVDRGSEHHLGFGAGIHYCLGAPLARLEAVTAFRALLTRFRSIARDPERRTVPIRYYASGTLGFESLPLVLG